MADKVIQEYKIVSAIAFIDKKRNTIYFILINFKDWCGAGWHVALNDKTRKARKGHVANHPPMD